MTRIRLWIVYAPVDMPDDYVARECVVTDDQKVHTGNYIQSRHLTSIRLSMMEMHLTCLARDEGDDPTIIESWI